MRLSAVLRLRLSRSEWNRGMRIAGTHPGARFVQEHEAPNVECVEVSRTALHVHTPGGMKAEFEFAFWKMHYGQPSYLKGREYREARGAPYSEHKGDSYA